MFLLFNVAIVGFLFVYEVAEYFSWTLKMLRLREYKTFADSRLIRSERSQQAKVINFVLRVLPANLCFYSLLPC